MKQNLIRAVDLIGKSMHPDHLNRTYTFAKKTELINHLLTYMKVESVRELSSETRSLAMQACATLVYPLCISGPMARLWPAHGPPIHQYNAHFAW